GAAEDVSATDDHADLAAEVDHLVDLPGDARQRLRIDAVVGIAHERLAGEFQQDTRVLQAYPDISGRQQNGGIVMDAAPCGENCARAAAVRPPPCHNVPMTDATETGAPVRTAAAVILDAQGRVLLVRKRGSTFFIQPGGKREPGETVLETLARELREELGVELRPGSAIALGEFEHVAVNEPGRRV